VLIPQVVNLQAELTYLQAHLATLELPSPPPLPAPPQMPVPAPFNISNLPSSATNVPTTADLSALFDTPPQAHQWAAVQQQQHHQHQHQQHQLRQASTSYGASVGMAESSSGGGGGDLQALARELLDRHRSGVKLESPPPPPPHSR
jgi:LOB domain-containing protein 18